MTVAPKQMWLDVVYTSLKTPYSKLSGTDVYYYGGSASAYDWASK